jgi:hypothetical protein
MAEAWRERRHSLEGNSSVGEHRGRPALAGNAAATGRWVMSDGKDVVIAWEAGHSWVRPSIPRVHQVVAVQLGMDRAYVKEHGDVGHEAVGTVEGTPC